VYLRARICPDGRTARRQADVICSLHDVTRMAASAMTEYFWWLAALLLVGGSGLVLVLSARTRAPDGSDLEDDGDEPRAPT
jgi:hypothetical protein